LVLLPEIFLLRFEFVPRRLITRVVPIRDAAS
jgi:hypothetical protein